MTLPRIATATLAAALLCAPAFNPSEAQAAPLTITLTGTIDSTFIISGTGTLAGLFNIGDAFTFTTTVDQSGPADQVFSNSTRTNQQWLTGNFTSLAINGETFTIGDSISQEDTSFAEARTTHDFIEAYAVDDTANSPVPGGATSSLAGVHRITLDWYLFDNDGQNDILDFSDPRFPTTIDLDDWATEGVYVVLEHFGTTSSSRAEFRNQDSFVFSSVTTSGAEESVPAPGALALLGFGFLGIGLRRRAA